MRSKYFGNRFLYDSGAGGGGGETKEEILLKKIKGDIESRLETRATKEEVKKISDELMKVLKGEDGKTDFPLEALRAMADEKTGVMAKLVEQGIAIQEFETQIRNQPKDMSVRSQCAAFLEKNKEKISQIRSGIRVDLEPFEVKLSTRAVATPMLPSTVMPGGTTYLTRTEIAPGINELLRPEPTFWDFIKKGTTGAETYVWINKRPTEGGAAFIGPGVYKPAISFSIEAENSKAKKVAVNEKMATELLEDIDGFTSWVETELRYQLMQKVNDTLMNSVETSTAPSGVQQLSTTYDALTGVKTTNANNWDAYKAAVTQLRIKRFKGPIVIFTNPVDLANAVMTKADNQGQLFIPPVVGAQIVEDLNIPLGYIQVIAIDYYKLLIYKAFSMKWGWENDDFTKNLVTVIAEMRIHQFHSENYDGFAIYDTIANIKSAIDVAGEVAE